VAAGSIPSSEGGEEGNLDGAEGERMGVQLPHLGGTMKIGEVANLLCKILSPYMAYMPHKEVFINI
jgi:hypothetical protein